MKADYKFAQEHYDILKENNPDKIFKIDFCEKAKEWVIVYDDICLHITDTPLDELSDTERDLIQKYQKVI